MMFLPILWFIIITAAIVVALPRVFDALLYYFDKRSGQYMRLLEMEERKNEIIREQIKLQQLQEGRRKIQ